MNRLRSAALCLVLAAFACGPVEDTDSISDDERVETTKQSLAVDDLYTKLRQLEGVLPAPAATQTVSMGTWVSGGSFVGLASTCTVVFTPFKRTVCTPPTTTLNAISAVLSFNVPDGVTLTANGKTAVSRFGRVTLDVGNADVVTWKLQSGSYSYGDTLWIRRPDVGGVGAFTVAALPVTIVYDPPQNAARTNQASANFSQERTVVNTLTTGSSTINAPEWAEGKVAKEIGVKLAKKFPVTAAAYKVLQGVITAWGSVDTTQTSRTEVNTDRTLSVKVATTQNISATSRGGPGRGDVVVFYSDARVAWSMDEGKVSLTMLDHGPLMMVTVDTLNADLAAANAGQTAPVTRLDAETLSALIKLDPMASTSNRPWGSPILGGGVTLPASRFTNDGQLLVNGASYTQSVSHTISQSDRVSTMNATTTVKDYHPGWLTLIGVGQTQAGKVTTTISLGASRTTTTSNTKGASITLNAGPTESYRVDVHYDNIFGTFLTRTPPPPPIVIGGGLAVQR
ncbi:MAG: hypothetical protein KF795_30025 [Labilithrix sp.]|nr:hypothetical protein [Labilithrix sp.]